MYNVIMKIMQVWFSDRQMERLKKESKEKDLSVAEIIRRILDSYLFGDIVKNTKFDKIMKKI